MLFRSQTNPWIGLNAETSATNPDQGRYTYTGFTYNASSSTYSYGTAHGTGVTTSTEILISADGSTVVNLYFTRDKYTLTVKSSFGGTKYDGLIHNNTVDMAVNGGDATTLSGTNAITYSIYYGSKVVFSNLVVSPSNKSGGFSIMDDNGVSDGAIDSPINITSKTTVTFAFTYAEYDITYKVDGGHFDIDSEDATYTENGVTYTKDANGSWTIATGKYKTDKPNGGQNSVLAINPVKTGYTFSGWTIKFDGTGANLPEIADGYVKAKWNSYGNVTVTAQWMPITYTITLHANNSDSADEATKDLPAVSYDMNRVLPTIASQQMCSLYKQDELLSKYTPHHK